MYHNIGNNLVKTEFHTYSCPQCKKVSEVIVNISTDKTSGSQKKSIGIDCKYCVLSR